MIRHDCIARITPLPPSIRGMTVIDADDTANIYISANLSHEARESALLHELKHLMRNDHHREDAEIRSIEKD